MAVLLVGLGVGVLPTTPCAAPPEPPPVSIPSRDEDPGRRALEPRGHPLAGGTLHATLESRLTLDDAITASAPAVTLAPAVSYHHGPSPWRLRLDAGLEDVRHVGHRRSDHRDLRLGARVWAGGGDGSRAHLGIAWQRGHERPGDVLAGRGAGRGAGRAAGWAAGDPVAVTQRSLDASLVLRRGIVETGLAGVVRGASHGSGQHHRDRAEVELRQRITMQTLPALHLVTEGRVEVLASPSAGPFADHNRGALAQAALGGVVLDLPERLAAEVLVGQVRRTPVVRAYAPMETTMIEGAGTLALTTLTTITAQGWRRLGRTEAPLQAMALESGWQVGLHHELLRQVELSVDLRRQRRDHIGLLPMAAEADDMLRLGILYRRDARWYAGLEGRWDRRRGGEPGSAFHRSRVTLSVGARL